MTAPNIDSSYDFIFAKLHGMWANSIRGEVLDRLVLSGTMETLQRNFQSIGLNASKREDFNTALYLREHSRINEIARLLDSSCADFYSAYMARAYYDNIKTLLHYRYFPELESDIRWLIYDVPGLPAMNPDDILGSKTSAEFIHKIPMDFGLMQDVFTEIVLVLEKKRDIVRAECKLDQLYYNNVLDAASRMPSGMRKEVRQLVRTQIDVLNICMLLRNIRTYRIAGATMQSFWLEEGMLLDKARLTALSEEKDIARAVRELPVVYSKILAPFTEAMLQLSENVLWNHIYKEALKLFQNFDKPALAIVAFPFLLHFETQNLGRIYEGVRFGIPSRDIRDMIIGA